MRIAYRFDELPGFSRLFATLVHEPAAVASFLPVGGMNAEALLRRAGQARAERASISEEVFDAILAQNLGFGAHPKAIENINKLRDGHCLVVGAVTGMFLFGGPMETFYQALTVVQAAAFLAEQGIPAAPLLWVDPGRPPRHQCILDVQNVPRSLPFCPENLHGNSEVGPNGSTDLDSSFEKLKSFLPVTAFAERLYAEIQSSRERSANGESCQARLLARLLSRFGLIVFTPDASFRQGRQNQLESEVAAHADELAALKSKRRQQLAPWISDPSLLRAEGESSLSVEPRQWAGALIPFQLLPWIGRVCLPEDTLEAILLQPLLKAIKLSDPVLLASASITVVEPKVSKVLEKFDLELADFLIGDDRLGEKISNRFESLRAAGHFEQAGARIQMELQGLRSNLNVRDRELVQVFDNLRDKILYQIQNLKNKQEQSWQRQWEIAQQQVDKARSYLYPQGRRQEQALNVNYFLVRHGLEFLEKVNVAISAFNVRHCLFFYLPSQAAIAVREREPA